MYICICNDVTDRQVREALDQGARSMRDLNKELNVGSKCGKCVSAARQVMRSHNFEDDLAYEAR
ncbi:(2Fe-2S)-binding protein [Marinobacterium jannaschii]|uniref:(2Fe-2S)-binding protein n=1 Tax=Marinobacterium jannaschii TaxID=64970 RepID=UPI000482EC85|nr:(2Fe-2S)-binding protein [Marinobacterium jannaschii]